MYQHGRIVQPTTKAFKALFVQKRSRVIAPSINTVRSPRNTTIPAVATHRSLASSTSTALRMMALAFRLLTAVAAQTNAEKPSICCKISIQYICTHVIDTCYIISLIHPSHVEVHHCIWQSLQATPLGDGSLKHLLRQYLSWPLDISQSTNAHSMYYTKLFEFRCILMPSWYIQQH